MPSSQGTGWRRITPAKRVEQRLRPRTVEIFVKIVIDLQDRRVDAGAETLDFHQCEESILRGAADADAKLVFARADHVVRTAQPARGRRAGLQQVAPDRTQVEHGVKGRDL